MKPCTKCGAVKPFSEFSPHKCGIGGVRSICKPCSVKQVMAYRATDDGIAAHRKASRKHATTVRGAAGRTASNRAAAQRDPVAYLLIRARSRAKAKGLPFTITRADIVIPDRCPVLGVRLVVATKTFRQPGAGGNDNSMSLDRLRPELGYVPGNVAVISWRANRLKGQATIDELERIVAWLKSVGSA